tara:strand:- start:283 stop:477 length:195 start_codon:yes stop_codon:yes gene_type:complete
MNIKGIKNCQDCPFANNCNEYGYDGCNLKEIELEMWEELPAIGVHKDCPLKEDNFLMVLDKQII